MLEACVMRGERPHTVSSCVQGGPPPQTLYPLALTQRIVPRILLLALLPS